MILDPLLALGITVGLFGLLFLPGFVLSFVLFPKRNTLEGLERIAVSVGLSIALLVLVGYTLNLTPWGVQLGSALAAIGITVIGGSVYYRIRYRHSYKERLTDIGRSISPQNTLALVLIVGIVFGLSWLAITPPGAEPVTEFFVVDQEVQDHYLKLTLGVINHEPDQTAYTLRMQTGDVVLDEASSVLLESGEEWKTTLTLQLSDTWPDEPLRLAILLFRDGDTEPYRNLHLWLENGTLR
jgi:uncharacterized membrane protein